MGPHRRAGVTMVEVLIVVVILAIIAGLVFPELSTATEEARLTALEANLNHVRKQVALYRLQHRDTSPTAAFVNQMTRYTNTAGEVADAKSEEHRFGPYLTSLPPNPITGLDTVRLDDAPTGFVPPETSGGWYFNPTTGDFEADLAEEDQP